MEFDPEKIPARAVYNLLIGLVAPRPIAWVTSMDEEGRLNAAPFSSYNYLCTDPPVVGIATNRLKSTCGEGYGSKYPPDLKSLW